MNKRMNNFRCLLLALPGMLLMAGCDKSALPEQENNEPVELQIMPTVALTRSAVQDAKSLDEVAVYATGADYTAGNNYAVYTNKTSRWDNEGSESIYLTNADATIYGYYPTTTKFDASAKTIPVTVNETDAITAIDNSTATTIASASGEVDYMYATPVSSVNNKSGNNVTLVMNHALSMVSFRVYKAADYKGPGNLTKVVMENVGAGTTLNKGTSPTMDITTGAINEGAAQQAVYTRTITDYTLASTANDSKKFSILVLPTASAIGYSNIKATFTIDGADYSVNLTQPTAAGTEGKWQAGYNNLYTVKMGGTDLTITTVTVAEWKETAVNGELDIK